MKYISYFFLILAVFITTTAFPQQGDTIKVYVNGKLAGQEVLKGQSEKVTYIKKSKYARITRLKISVNQSTAKGSIFNRGIDIEGSADSTILRIKEMSKSPGCFTIDVAKAKAIAKAYKEIKVYYTEDPKNPRMMVRSLRKLIATLRFE
jgi:hypothetical protein